MSTNFRLVSIFLFIFLAAMLVTVGSAGAGQLISSDRDPLQLIEKDFKAGHLTRDEKALLQVQAIRQPDKLPAKFHTITSASDRVGSRSATLALLDIRLNWNSLRPTTQAQVAEAMARHTTVFTYLSPSGFFKFHYDTAGTHAVPTADANSNNIPDFVEKCAAYCDSSLQKQLAMGFVAPPSDGTAGGDSLFDVYFENTAYYGYAVPENPGPQPWPDFTSYLVLNRNFLGFPPNDDPEGDVAGAAKVTAAHEFHHCIQFAYDASEGNWFMELDATCMEDIVFNQVNDNYNYLPYYMNYPDTSLMTNAMQLHWYSSFIWERFLVEKFDTALMRAVWNGARYTSVYQSMSDSLQAAFGWSEDSAFVEFSKWCFATGGRNDGLHFAEAAQYPLVDLSALYFSYPVNTTQSASTPQGYGATYIQFQPGAESGNLRVIFDGSDSRQWAAYVIVSPTFNSHQFVTIPLTAGTYTGWVDIPSFDTNYAVTLVAVNLSEFSSAGGFSYSAHIVSPYAVATSVATDSGIYSGATRQFQLRVHNPGPIGDVYKVKATDNHGWITPSSQDVFVASHDSSTVNIPVSVPDGTPLGSTSNLVFSAISKSDSLIADTSRVTAVTVLQRGDVVFDGNVDVADLTRLIDYLFLTQTPFSPLEAGNLDCQGSVDITDLTWLINQLFAFGPTCPCNPY